MLNMRSTLAEEAGTPKNFLANGASKGKTVSFAFQNERHRNRFIFRDFMQPRARTV